MYGVPLTQTQRWVKLCKSLGQYAANEGVKLLQMGGSFFCKRVGQTSRKRPFAPTGVSIAAFYRRFSLLKDKSPTVAIPLIHKPGERVQVDYADGIPIYCRISRISASRFHHFEPPLLRTVGTPLS